MICLTLRYRSFRKGAFTAFVLGIAMLSAMAEPYGEGPVLATPDIIGRSLISEGDLSRLDAVFAKAKRGEPITLGFIGGSITEGAIATKPDHRYANLVVEWWQKAFPQTKFTLVNAGIGATNSIYGSLRAQRDLLSKKPDFVVVDFGVNDQAGPEPAESYEGLVRQILQQPQRPAVVLLFMSRDDGVNAQEWQSKIGDHYQLPMVSYRNAFWPEIQSGRISWSTIGADYIHPNDLGHACTAWFITALLQKTLENAPKTLPAASLPAPILSDTFERTALFEASDLYPLRNDGWTYDSAKKAWLSSIPGSVIEFEISGRRLFFMDYHINGPMGKVSVQVDERPSVTRDGWFEKTWGGYRETVALAKDLSPGRHRVKVELLDTKNPQSSGNEFRILGLGAAGTASTEKMP